MRIFFDSSAFAKRYLLETGSDRVLELCEEASAVVLSQIAPVEILSAASRLRRDGVLPTAKYRVLKRSLAEDLKAIEIVEMNVEIVGLAVHSIEQAPLRTLDAIQLAAALAVKCGLFVSSDIRQLRAAHVLKLRVEQV